MLTFTDAQVLGWITPILWPFLRVLALFSVLPVIAQQAVHRILDRLLHLPRAQYPHGPLGSAYEQRSSNCP